MFVEFKLLSDESVWVNSDHVAYLWKSSLQTKDVNTFAEGSKAREQFGPQEDEDTCRICITDRKEVDTVMTFVVKGTPAEVASKLNSPEVIMVDQATLKDKAHYINPKLFKDVKAHY
jgi:hypothetical protein